MKVPEDLPVPVDDGAARHLEGSEIPEVALHSTRDRWVLLSEETADWVVVYCYPMTGRPGQALPEGWDQIPGARGCTQETCAFRDHNQELRELGAEVFGLSTQDSHDQAEMTARLGVPYEVLSDANLDLTSAMRLPTFRVDGRIYLKRLTMVLHAGRVAKVYYPVFPPDRHPGEVVAWVRAQRSA